MKNISLLLLFVVLSAYSARAQKHYIGCPENIATQPKAGFLAKQPVDLVIVDKQTIPSNTKIECAGPGIKQVLKNFLQSRYPGCTLTLLADTGKAASAGRITIRLSLAAYQAVLAKSEWTATVSYHVTIFDYRNGKTKKISEDISNDTTKPNISIWNYTTARKCLFESFDKSNQDLEGFIEGSLKE